MSNTIKILTILGIIVSLSLLILPEFVNILSFILIIFFIGLLFSSFFVKEPKVVDVPKAENKALDDAYRKMRILAEEKDGQEQKIIDKSRKLNTLMQIARSMSHIRQLDELMNLIVTRAKEEMNTSESFLFLRGEKGRLQVNCQKGFSQTSVDTIEKNINNKVFEKVLNERTSVRLSIKENAQELEALGNTREKIRNLLCVPLIPPQEKFAIGILGVANLLVEDNFTEEQEDYLSTLAIDAAMFLNTAKLINDLERSYYEMIKALAQAMEARDPYTRGHIDRVQHYSELLAVSLKLSKKKIEIISQAAILHDVGKIGTRDNILLKPGDLTQDERVEMNQHVLHSVAILKDISSINNEVLDIVLHHHEKYDGHGYPHGLAGNNIPLGARIIAVADTYDAMITDRPYRKAFTLEEAIEKMSKASGTQFDPQVFEAFRNLAFKGKIKL